MPVRHLDPQRFEIHSDRSADANADWHGNNAAFTCPVCAKVYIVTTLNKEGTKGRDCPGCGRSKAFITGSPKAHKAWIQWD
jgi:transcription elongation factor Elf1